MRPSNSEFVQGHVPHQCHECRTLSGMLILLPVGIDTFEHHYYRPLRLNSMG